MKRTYLGLILLCCILTLGAILPPEYASFPLEQDPDVISGTLDNGLKYYIKQNAKPEKRLELRLLINAGSVVEDDDQLGLAHFVEHMAFNGTKNFKKNNIEYYEWKNEDIKQLKQKIIPLHEEYLKTSTRNYLSETYITLQAK